MEKIFVVDALNYLFRAYFAIRGMKNAEGVSTNALYGFIRAVEKIKKDFNPEYLVVVFDGPDNKASRVDIYEDYKGHRDEMPDDLGPQLALAKQYLDAAGIPHIEAPGVEADDTMGTVAKWAEKQGLQTYLCSSDKDLCQLVNENILIVHTHKDNLVLDAKGVEAKFGVRADQIIDYLAIVGDSSDNIPGIPGFGPKTAATLLAQFDSLKEMLENPEAVKNPKREEKIRMHSADARMSYKLATIQLDVNIPKETSFYKPAKGDFSALKHLYEEMRFNTFLRELKAPKDTEQEPAQKAVAGSYTIIQSLEELKALLAKLNDEKVLCIDTETTAIKPMEAKLLGIGLTSKVEEGYYIPFNGDLPEEKLLELIAPFLSNPNRTYVGHNLKYDMHVLQNYHIAIAGELFDTMIASYLLDSAENRHGLDHLCLEHFNHRKISIQELSGAKSKKNISLVDVPIEKVGPYCCEDVDYTMRLKVLFEKEIEKRKMGELFYEMEMPLLTVLFWMERSGIYLDIEYMKGLSKDFSAKIAHLESSIHELAGEEFNIKSPKQLSHILFETLDLRKLSKKKQTGYSTSADVLEALKHDHPIVPKIIEFRGLEKLRSTYIDALPDQVNPKTHRIHCTFNQSGTATGRLSSNNPNLQNIPIRSEDGRKVREGFRPQKSGWSFLSLDYSQIELRIVAHMSGDPTMLKAFADDEDIHRFTAAKVYDIPLEAVTKEMRSKAKAVNFGLIYGQGSYGLSKELNIPLREASNFIKAYFERYPKVHEFLEESKKSAEQEGVAITLFGRERAIPDIKNRNAAVRAAATRIAVNAPIQGTQADIIKMAMIEVDQFLHDEELESFLILQIHDELIFECPDSELEKVQKEVTDIMQSVVSLDVQLKVDNSIGKNWGDC